MQIRNIRMGNMTKIIQVHLTEYRQTGGDADEVWDNIVGMGWRWVQNILPCHPLVPQSPCKFWSPPAVQKILHLANYRPSLAATPLYSVGWPLVRISIPVQHGRPSLCGGCNTSDGRRVLHHLTLKTGGRTQADPRNSCSSAH